MSDVLSIYLKKLNSTIPPEYSTLINNINIDIDNILQKYFNGTIEDNDINTLAVELQKNNEIMKIIDRNATILKEISNKMNINTDEIKYKIEYGINSVLQHTVSSKSKINWKEVKGGSIKQIKKLQKFNTRRKPLISKRHKMSNKFRKRIEVNTRRKSNKCKKQTIYLRKRGGIGETSNYFIFTNFAIIQTSTSCKELIINSKQAFDEYSDKFKGIDLEDRYAKQTQTDYSGNTEKILCAIPDFLYKILYNIYCLISGAINSLSQFTSNSSKKIYKTMKESYKLKKIVKSINSILPRLSDQKVYSENSNIAAKSIYSQKIHPTDEAKLTTANLNYVKTKSQPTYYNNSSTKTTHNTMSGINDIDDDDNKTVSTMGIIGIDDFKDFRKEESPFDI